MKQIVDVASDGAFMEYNITQAWGCQIKSGLIKRTGTPVQEKKGELNPTMMY